MPYCPPLAHRRAIRPTFVALLALGALACGGGSDPTKPPPPPTPGELTATAGATAQTATVATAVPTTPAVRVRSTADQPMAGVTVTFAVTAGGGSVGAASAQTNADGVASPGTWTLGATAGANELTATVSGLPAVRFTATGTPGPVAHLEPVTLDQAGIVGAALAQPPAVRAVDAHGNAVAGVAVTFAVTAGGGAIGAAEATTGADGRASAGAWTLGTAPGANSVTATAQGLAPVVLTATAQTGAPARLELVSGGGQDGMVATVLSTPVAVKVLDAHGNPVGGVQVAFAVSTGGGSVASPVATSGADGVASAGQWTLGTVAGAHFVHATTAGVQGIEVPGEARAGPPLRLELVSGGGQQDTIEAVLPEPVVMRALDGYDNPVADAAVAFAVTGGGGAVQPAQATTDAAGRVTMSWTLGATAGSHVVQATVPGSAALPSTVTAEARWPTFRVLAVQTQGLFVCALDARQVLKCWGRNESGQLGDGTTEERAVPQPVAAGAPAFQRISAGYNHACALTAAGKAYCWGDNNAWQVGDFTDVDRPTPTAVSGGDAFTLLVSGGAHNCALRANGTAWCWGSGGWGQLGEGTDYTHGQPVAVAGDLRFKTLAAGSVHSCGVSENGATYCWGDNMFGQIGGSTEQHQKTPWAVSGGHTFVSVTAGQFFTCALRPDGAAFCWGRNSEGQLGDGTTTDRATPAPAAPGLRFTDLEAGLDAVCGLTAAGEVHCWGSNSAGVHGTGFFSNSPITTPQRVAAPAGVAFSAISVGATVACGIATDQRLFCWGVNISGSVGDGTTLLRPAPTPVRGR